LPQFDRIMVLGAALKMGAGATTEKSMHVDSLQEQEDRDADGGLMKRLFGQSQAGGAARQRDRSPLALRYSAPAYRGASDPLGDLWSR
jgi:hypothetical protein